MNRRKFNHLIVASPLALGTSTTMMGRTIAYTPTKNDAMSNNKYEVIIIGGSYAGLSAAMTLGRSIRKTLVIDSGRPCNRYTPHAHNFITQDGAVPSKIAALAAEQVRNYSTVSFVEDQATNVSGEDGNFQVTTLAKKEYRAAKIIFATGIKDILPNIPGFEASWGKTVIHCPYCHGYEVKGKKTGIWINDESALDFAQLILNWTDDLTVFTNGAPTFEVAALTSLGVEVVSKPIASIQHQQGKIDYLTFEDKSTHPLTALYHRAKYEQHCKIPEKLGCDHTESGHIAVNDLGQTSVAGVYAVGDATTFFRSISIAVAAGTKAGAILNHELINAEK